MLDGNELKFNMQRFFSRGKQSFPLCYRFLIFLSVFPRNVSSQLELVGGMIWRKYMQDTLKKPIVTPQQGTKNL